MCSVPSRSTKAGAFVPAIRVLPDHVYAVHPPLNEGRGFRPGDPRRAHGATTGQTPLNEGRGFRPGDPVMRPTCQRVMSSAQRRPGLSSRRSARFGHGCGIGSVPAQRRPGLSSRRSRAQGGRAVRIGLRSTKAGAFVPAIPGRARERRSTACPLNEGRGFRPGDPAQTASRPTWSGSAQRRPGLSSRRSPPTCSVRSRRPGSLNEGRGFRPGDPSPGSGVVYGPATAQRRPGLSSRRSGPPCR